jgi:hypothetical protein
VNASFGFVYISDQLFYHQTNSERSSPGSIMRSHFELSCVRHNSWRCVAGSLPAWYLSGRQLKTPKATVKAAIKEAHQSISYLPPHHDWTLVSFHGWPISRLCASDNQSSSEIAVTQPHSTFESIMGNRDLSHDIDARS